MCTVVAERPTRDASTDRTAILWQWRGAALALIGIAAVVFALDRDERWWGPLQESLELIGFDLVLGGPAIAVSSLVSSLLPSRVVVRVVLDLVAATWTAWMAGFLVDLSFIRPDGPLPRSAWFVVAGWTAIMLVSAWRLEDALARRRLNRRRDRSTTTA